MPSRDRLRECQAKKAFEESLEGYLGDHAILAHLNKERREAELRDRLADDKPLSDALKSIVDSSPELRALFRLGVTLPMPSVPGSRDEVFIGLRYPTFFRLAQRDEDDGHLFDCSRTRGARIHFETDAINDYFTRQNDPGSVTIVPAVMFDRVLLHNGRATLVVRCPPKAKIDDELEAVVNVSDSRQKTPFVSRFRLHIVEDRPARDPTDGPPPPPKTGGLALPKVIEVEEDDWANEEFGPESGLAIQRDVDGGLIAKVNVANANLKNFLLRSSPAEVDIIRKRFVYGLVLGGISFWEQFRDDEATDELIRDASSALARVLLPMITVLGSLDSVDIDRYQTSSVD